MLKIIRLIFGTLFVLLGLFFILAFIIGIFSSDPKGAYFCLLLGMLLLLCGIYMFKQAKIDDQLKSSNKVNDIEKLKNANNLKEDSNYNSAKVLPLHFNNDSSHLLNTSRKFMLFRSSHFTRTGIVILSGAFIASFVFNNGYILGIPLFSYLVLSYVIRQLSSTYIVVINKQNKFKPQYIVYKSIFRRPLDVIGCFVTISSLADISLIDPSIFPNDAEETRQRMFKSWQLFDSNTFILNLASYDLELLTVEYGEKWLQPQPKIIHSGTISYTRYFVDHIGDGDYDEPPKTLSVPYGIKHTSKSWLRTRMYAYKSAF